MIQNIQSVSLLLHVNEKDFGNSINSPTNIFLESSDISGDHGNIKISLIYFGKSWVGQSRTRSGLVNSPVHFFPFMPQDLSHKTVCGTPSLTGSRGMSKRSHGQQLSRTLDHRRKSWRMNCLSSIAPKPWWRHPSGLMDCNSVQFFLFAFRVISIQLDESSTNNLIFFCTE